MSGKQGGPSLVVVVRPGSRAREIRRWLRVLLPSAILVATPAALPTGDAYEVVTVDADADAADAGPLSIARAITRDLHARVEVSGGRAAGEPARRGTLRGA
jgi:hypothetical protein